MLIYSYEDMKEDLEQVVRKVADFLDKKIPEEKMSLLLEHLSFDSMKNNPMVNKSDIVKVID